METLAGILGVIGAGIGLFAAILWIRNDGLQGQLVKEVVDRRAAEAATKVATAQLAETISRARAKEEALIRKLEHYENHELDAIESEPNRAKRISRRRDWISSVLSEATGTQD